ncbi:MULTISPECIES: hypothetical protein [Cupriavidus]
MTLVVGKVTSEIGFLVADTLLSPIHEGVYLRGQAGDINGQHHVLKIHILNGQTAIAFAGDPNPAVEIIAAVKEDIERGAFGTASERLLQRYIDKRRERPTIDCDFLVLRLQEGRPILEKISAATGLQSVCQAYIGDAGAHQGLWRRMAAYNCPVAKWLQRADGIMELLPFEPLNGEAEFARVSDALTALVQSRTYPSVGAISDAITRVINARISGELEYLQEIYAGQSPEEDFTGFTLLAANTDPRAMAIYFYAGCVGFLLIPGDIEGGRRIAAATQRDFVDAVTKNYGIVLTGAEAHRST